MFAAGKTAAVSGAGPDDKFNYVTMLLHGDGTNGAQNNTFLDSSASPLTITRNGNTTQGSFSPYGSNWSNYFDGNGDYLTAANNTALDVGTGAFTIEGWIYRDGTGDADWRIIAGNTSNAGFFGGRGTLSLGFGRAAVAWDLESASNVYSLNTWTHVVYVRNGSGNLAIFANGTRVATTTNSNNYGLNGGLIEVGAEGANQYFGGYISNVRLVKGTAVYDPTASTLTVPTTPLTAVSGTGLLTCQSNRFIDNSSSPKTLTVNGNTSVQRFNPFGTSTAYSTAVIGGSGYFDGSGDYLQIADSSAFTFGSGDFTVEFWIYSNNTSLTLIIGQNNGNPSSSSFDVRYNGTTITGNIFSSGTTYAVAESMSKNAWHHVALVRNGTSLRIYVDGVSTSSTSVSTVSVNDSSNVLRIGASSETTPDYYFNGYMTDARIVKGTAVYTSNFTPPTAPLTAITNTQLLTNFINGAIFDNAMMNDLETVGNAQISTSVKKYGTGSLSFDGTGDWLQNYNTSVLRFNGSSTFTVEGWFYQTAYVSTAGQMNNVLGDLTPDTATALYYSIGMNSSNQAGIRWYDGAVKTVAGGTTLTQNVWNHIAWVVTAGVVKIFVNGVSETLTGTTTLTAPSSTVGYLIIGADRGYYMTGYMDDLRITNGYARYPSTTTFTPPTSAFSDTGPY